MPRTVGLRLGAPGPIAYRLPSRSDHLGLRPAGRAAARGRPMPGKVTLWMGSAALRCWRRLAACGPSRRTASTVGYPPRSDGQGCTHMLPSGRQVPSFHLGGGASHVTGPRWQPWGPRGRRSQSCRCPGAPQQPVACYSSQGRDRALLRLTAPSLVCVWQNERVKAPRVEGSSHAAWLFSWLTCDMDARCRLARWALWTGH